MNQLIADGLTANQMTEIAKRAKAGEKPAVLAREFNCEGRTVRQLKDGTFRALFHKALFGPNGRQKKSYR